MTDSYQEYFNYYLELEKDFFLTEPYVTIEKDNFATFSIQYNRIYQSICSEIDSLLKVLCRQLDGKCKADKLSTYCKVIQESFPHFNSEIVYFYKSRIELQPWKEWTAEKAPLWWTMYNKVKHHRVEINKETEKPYYQYANLENVLNALAALYIVEEYYIYSLNSGDETGKKACADALERAHSGKCVMKRWMDAGCYSGFMGQKFFEIERLEKIMGE